MINICKKISTNIFFDAFIIFLIVINAIILGLETNKDIDALHGKILEHGNDIILILFIIEAVIKIIANFKKYFGNGWDIFDFSIILLSLMPFGSNYSMIVRLLRVLRIISKISKLRLIISVLLNSIPSMGSIMFLMMLLIYIYAIIGFHLYGEDLPDSWGTLGKAMITLSTVATLEGWDNHLKACLVIYPYAWIYFISFIVLATFIIINLFIAVILDNMETIKKETSAEMASDNAELLEEFHVVEAQLKALGKRIEHMPK